MAQWLPVLLLAVPCLGSSFSSKTARVMIGHSSFPLYRATFGRQLLTTFAKSRRDSDKKKDGWKGNKSNLPSKDCVVCGRPFTWRKKWERCWDEVKYCSDKCRRTAKTTASN
mmetsp:Transcript_20637/g.38826  ORF Transcript_20637/g.38826 Transcript_20637/m.38826 type:complete len:112 (-) Transcript_20637:188-523(-)